MFIASFMAVGIGLVVVDVSALRAQFGKGAAEVSCGAEVQDAALRDIGNLSAVPGRLEIV
jgi:hypothetical protein